MKWEYCKLETYSNPAKPFQAQVVYYTTNEGVPIESTLSKTIAALGMNGWELVSHQLTEREGVFQEFFMFKRPT